MKQSDFENFIQQLRSDDSLTYEEGYHSIKGRVDEVLSQLIQLAQAETEERGRSKFVELIGESIQPEAIHFLETELASPFYEVRMWAYSSLSYSESQSANEIAAKFKDKNPHEAFL